jgi:hypothetical protein
MEDAAPPVAAPQSHLLRNAVIVVVLLAAFVALITVPVPQAYSYQILTPTEVQ